MRPFALTGVLLTLASACGGGVFACIDDGDCVGPAGGLCEPDGACSFPDDACPSGRRYGEFAAPDLAGTCVEPGDGSSTGGTTAPATSTTSLPSTEDGDSTAAPAPDVGTVPATTGEPCPADWWDCGFRHRVPLTLDPGQSTALLDVTIPLRLGADRLDSAVALPDGADVRVVDDDGIVLAHEIERWDPAGTSVLWLRVPVLGDVPLSLWLYYGNPAAPAVEAVEVWSDAHAAVWHMDGAVIDATGNTAAGVIAGAVSDAEGYFGRALAFGAPDDRVDVAPADATSDVFLAGGTLSAWVHADSFGGTLRGRIADNTEGGPAGWMFYLSGDAAGALAWRLGYPGGQTIWHSPSGTIALATWHHVAVVFDPAVDDEPHLYIDGVPYPAQLNLGGAVGEPLSDAGQVVTIGNSDVWNRWFDGRIDELRIERVARDEAWIAVQYRAMTDALVGYGAIESLPDAG